MRKIIENLTVTHQLTLVAGANSESLDMYTLGSKEGYLIERAYVALAAGSAAPSVTGAGLYRFEIGIVTGDRVTATHGLVSEDLVAIAGETGGALAAKDIVFGPAMLDLGRVIPAGNVFVTGNTVNITNAATTIVQIRLDYSVVSLTLSEVNEYLTR